MTLPSRLVLVAGLLLIAGLSYLRSSVPKAMGRLAEEHADMRSYVAFMRRRDRLIGAVLLGAGGVALAAGAVGWLVSG